MDTATRADIEARMASRWYDVWEAAFADAARACPELEPALITCLEGKDTYRATEAALALSVLPASDMGDDAAGRTWRRSGPGRRDLRCVALGTLARRLAPPQPTTVSRRSPIETAFSRSTHCTTSQRGGTGAHGMAFMTGSRKPETRATFLAGRLDGLQLPDASLRRAKRASGTSPQPHPNEMGRPLGLGPRANRTCVAGSRDRLRVWLAGLENLKDYHLYDWANDPRFKKDEEPVAGGA